MRTFGLFLLLLLGLDACGSSTAELPPTDARAWRALAEDAVPGLEGAWLEGCDPMGDWKLAHESGLDWSLLAVTPEARGTWRLSLRRSAWSEASEQVLSESHPGVLVLSEPLELAPGEHVQAFFQILADGRELFVPDTRLALLARVEPARWGDAHAGFRRVPPPGSGGLAEPVYSTPYDG